MPMRRESNRRNIGNCNTIDVKVFNWNVMALLDTGASRSCISKAFANKLKLKISPIHENYIFLTSNGICLCASCDDRYLLINGPRLNLYRSLVE